MHMAMHIGVGTNQIVSHLESVTLLDKKGLNENMQMVYCSKILSSKRHLVGTSLPCPFKLSVSVVLGRSKI